MSDDEVSQLKRGVEFQNGCTATFVERAQVHEKRDGETWDRTVTVFDLIGHPKSTRAFAWSTTRPDGAKQLTVVMQGPMLATPVDAVRRAMTVPWRAANAPRDPTEQGPSLGLRVWRTLTGR